MTTTQATDLSFKEAMVALKQGHKIKLPEWTGYYFQKPIKTKYGEALAFYAFTKTGDIVESPNYMQHSHRTDWQITDGSLGFDFAILALKAGKRVARKGWNGKNMWILAQFPDAHSKMTHPYLYIEYPTGHPAYPKGSRVPWLASQTDMLAEDWEVVA